MHWRVKGAIQKVLGRVPGGARVHHLLQRYGGGLAKFGAECDTRVEDWRLMVGHLRTSKLPIAGARLVEIGTGWYPTLPVCLWLGGAERVHTFDLNRHVREEATRALVAHLEKHVGTIAEASGLAASDVEARRRELQRALERGASIASATDGAIDYRAPADAAKTSLADGSIDVVFSSSVLEHIPGPVIEDCFREAQRILRPGGVVFHSVNCGDHYAYIDGAISQLHYLRYSESAWRKWNNAFLYQNRLRAEDFTRMAERAGFAIEIDTSRPHPTRLKQLDEIRVHPWFAERYSRDQLAITSIDFVGRKAS
ncbi:MAG: class I SAM-dependent methyltransferase [Labilithrix sp.]|nr:class I SAM-dependent methyltransferase [Labilithrix sp.]